MGSHVFDIRPSNTGFGWLGGRCAEHLNIAQIHESQSVKLPSCRRDSEIDGNTVEVTWGRVILACFSRNQWSSPQTSNGVTCL